MPSSDLFSATEHYAQALETFQDVPDTPSRLQALEVLKARDRVQVLLSDKAPDSSEALSRVLELDELMLKQSIRMQSVLDFAAARAKLVPPETAWWWQLDKKSEERKKRGDLPWEILAGIGLLFATPVALDIIRRFLDGAPDTMSILGALLTLLLTASPLTKHGREIAFGILSFLPFIRPSQRVKAMALASWLILVLLLLVQQWLLPYPLATYYNNQGVEARAAHNLTAAQQSFQRAAALNPDRVVPYNNLADAYRDAGLEDQAADWYQKAIERDANFAPAYRGLGELNNQQGKYATAERILLGGLSTEMPAMDEVAQKVTRYELLANLGWSYFGQEKTEMAQAALESALNLENDLKTMGATRGAEYRLALPHYYLAQVYEQIGNAAAARTQWEEVLRFLNVDDWHQYERYQTAQEHLKALDGK